MNDYTKPVYALDGKKFKTVSGLCTYLSRKHGANEVSGVSKDGTLRVRRDGVILACYAVSAPVIGKPMTLTLQADSRYHFGGPNYNHISTPDGV